MRYGNKIGKHFSVVYEEESKGRKSKTFKNQLLPSWSYNNDSKTRDTNVLDGGYNLNNFETFQLAHKWKENCLSGSRTFVFLQKL